MNFRHFPLLAKTLFGRSGDFLDTIGPSRSLWFGQFYTTVHQKWGHTSDQSTLLHQDLFESSFWSSNLLFRVFSGFVAKKKVHGSFAIVGSQRDLWAKFLSKFWIYSLVPNARRGTNKRGGWADLFIYYILY